MDSALRSHPLEGGGVLAGVEVDGAAWVTHAVEIDGSVATPVYFELPEGARPKAISAIRKIDSRLGYIGDWHSHPMDAGPSSQDRASLREIAEDKALSLPPLLLIARRRGSEYVPEAITVKSTRITALEIKLAGSLSEPESRKVPHD
jgi:proteasome lid subunit RPN8/RPN11